MRISDWSSDVCSSDLGLSADVQLLADLPVASAGGDEAQHLALARGEAAGPVGSPGALDLAEQRNPGAPTALVDPAADPCRPELTIGRASGRDSVCPHVSNSAVAVI